MSAERYEVISKGDYSIKYLNCPVQVEKTQLLLDKIGNDYLCRVVLKSFSRYSQIKASVVSVVCYDKDGNELGIVTGQKIISEEPVHFGVEFGKDTVIRIPYVGTEKIVVLINSVTYSDMSVREINPMANKPVKPLLIPIDKHPEPDREIIKEALPKQKIVKINYVYSQSDGYWTCTCGQVNSDSEVKCTGCSGLKSAMSKIFSKEYVDSVLKEREEKAKIAEEEKRRKAEEEKKRIEELEEQKRKEKQKLKKKIVIGTPIAAFLILIIILSVMVFAPLGNLSKAEKMINAGDIYSAVSLLNSSNNDIKYSKDLRAILEDRPDISRLKDYDNKLKIRSFISYDSQGGDVNGKEELDYKEYMLLKTPKKEGYTFSNWTGTDQVADFSFEGDTLLVTYNLKAVWHSCRYEISINLNGGTMSWVRSSYDTSKEDIEIDKIPKKKGYKFVGWTGSGLDGVQEKIVIKAGDYGDKEYEAHWEVITYSITYDAGTGLNPAENPVSYTVEDLPVVIQNPIKTGYDGVWKSGGDIFAEIPLGSYGNIEITAEYTIHNYAITYELNGVSTDFTVNFDSNGGSGSIPPQTIDRANTLKYPETIPTKSGYVFAGWYDNSACSGSPYDFAADISENITLYAKWVSYSGQDVIPYNGSLTISAVSRNSSAKYYAFVPLVSGSVSIYSSSSWDTYGFLYDSNKSQLTSNDNGGDGNNFKITYSVTAGTLYYVWPAGYSSSGTLTVNIIGGMPADGGTNQSIINPATYTIEDEIALDNPVKTGYIFLGWSGTGIEGMSTSVTISEGSFGDREYTANWEIITYTITYNAGEGTDPGTNPLTYTTESPTIILINPEMEYYDGVWKNGDDIVAEIPCGSYGNIELTAEYTLHPYAITYCLNGGTNSEDNPATYTVKDEFTLANPVKEKPIIYTTDVNGNFTIITKTEYTFKGWYMEETFGTKVTKVSGHQDITLYAKWSEMTNTLKNQAYCRDGSYVYYGTYPQSKVTDSSIITALNSLAGTLPTSYNRYSWTSYGYYQGIDRFDSQSTTTDYMWYIDKEYNGEKYRGVYFRSYRPAFTYFSSSTSTSQQTDDGYYISTVYWFKYEPIKWRILSEENGEALILCDMIIDTHEYYYRQIRHYSGVEANDWMLSTIRSWLNETFYNTAFSALQKSIILEQTLTTNTYSGGLETTKDNVFLLTEEDVANSAYGFSTDTARQKKPTEYAKSQGAHTYNGNGYWWLRSPDTDFSDNECYVGGVGRVSIYYVIETWYGVVPALKIKL